jgi:hypothetical protein
MVPLITRYLTIKCRSVVLYAAVDKLCTVFVVILAVFAVSTLRGNMAPYNFVEPAASCRVDLWKWRQEVIRSAYKAKQYHIPEDCNLSVIPPIACTG